MKTGYILSVVALLSFVAGCKKNPKTQVKKTTEVNTNIDIPLAEDGIKSYFDEDVNAFALADDAAQDTKAMTDPVNNAMDVAQKDDFSWVDANETSKEFKVVYFDFDAYTVREDQQENLNANIAFVKKNIEESKFFGSPMPTVVIDGHACHSAGSRVYNLALSEKRAKVLADKFAEAGIPRECIKIVGRGIEMPAMVDGHPCEGDRSAQWPNRRDELRIVYS